MIVHAGLAARRTGGLWRGLLIVGPSGAGKSTSTLTLIERGWRLVADDRVVLWRSGEQVYGRAPAALHGLLEVRGVGVLRAPALRLAQVIAVLQHDPAPERVPEADRYDCAGVALPLVRLNLADPFSAARIAQAWSDLGSDAGSHRLDSAARERI